MSNQLLKSLLNEMEGELGETDFVYTRYEDPGHSWIKVPLWVLKSLGIENKISEYSYRDRPGSFFLEEDVDGSLFYTTFVKKYDENPSIRTIHIEDFDEFIIKHKLKQNEKF